MAVLGIEDPGIWSAYLLCIAAAVICAVYSMINWNKGDEGIHPEDIKWVKDEKEAKQDL